MHYVQLAQCKVENGQFLIEHSREPRRVCGPGVRNNAAIPFSNDLDDAVTLNQVMRFQVNTLAARADTSRPDRDWVAQTNLALANVKKNKEAQVWPGAG